MVITISSRRFAGFPKRFQLDFIAQSIHWLPEPDAHTPSAHRILPTAQEFYSPTGLIALNKSMRQVGTKAAIN